MRPVQLSARPRLYWQALYRDRGLSKMQSLWPLDARLTQQAHRFSRPKQAFIRPSLDGPSLLSQSSSANAATCVSHPL